MWQTHQQNALGLDDDGPGSVVQHKGLHKPVLGDADKGRLRAGGKHYLLGLLQTCRSGRRDGGVRLDTDLVFSVGIPVPKYVISFLPLILFRQIC